MSCLESIPILKCSLKVELQLRQGILPDGKNSILGINLRSFSTQSNLSFRAGDSTADVVALHTIHLGWNTSIL